MSLTPSTMLELGTTLPSFRLPDLQGRQVSEADFASAPALLVAFISVHCPYVKHIQQEFGRFSQEYQRRGLAIVAICANDTKTHPGDGLEGRKTQAAEAGFSFPYLFDESQQVAKAFHAACTPDLFLYDRTQRLVYRGQFDDSRPGNRAPVTGADLRGAVDAVLAGKTVSPDQKASIGCNIKWKPGNEPK